MNLFGEKIKCLRELHGLLQRDLAQKMGIDAPMLSKIENGERKAKKDQVAILSKTFKITERELIKLWLADKVLEVVKDQPFAIQTLHLAEKKLNCNKESRIIK
jgi:transcriptional regulator with XRE-family HTH domain